MVGMKIAQEERKEHMNVRPCKSIGGKHARAKEETRPQCAMHCQAMHERQLLFAMLCQVMQKCYGVQCSVRSGMSGKYCVIEHRMNTSCKSRGEIERSS